MVISTFSKTHFLIFHVNSQHIQNLKIEWKHAIVRILFT
jgi:hypothetical protein